MVQSLPVRDNVRAGSDIERGSRDMTDQHARSGVERTGDPGRGELIREFSEVLDRISRLLIQVTTRELTETYGLSLLQTHALETLWRGKSEMEMSSIATNTGLPASTVTSAIDRLVKLGLVERWHSDVDRRRVLAKVTPAGEEVMTRVDAWGLQLFEELLSKSDTESLVTCIEVFTAAEEQIHETFDIRRPPS